MKYDIWMSKYWTDISPGQFAFVPVQHLDQVEADSFSEACRLYVKSLGNEKYLNIGKFVCYGPTKLWPTEMLARFYKGDES